MKRAQGSFRVTKIGPWYQKGCTITRVSLHEYFAKPIRYRVLKRSKFESIEEDKDNIAPRTIHESEQKPTVLSRHGVTDDGELTQFVNSAGNGKANEELSGRKR